MTNSLKRLLLTLSLVLVIVIAAGVIKFNVFDVPYQGQPITYIAPNGDALIAHYKADDSVEITFLDTPTYHLKPSISASGARYSNDEGSIEFWTKGGEAMFIEQGVVSFKGQLENNPMNKLAGSVWKYVETQDQEAGNTNSPSTQITLNFDQQQFFGDAQCHNFFGDYRYSNNQPTDIHFSNITVNRLTCEASLMAQEQALLALLQQVDSIHYREEKLTLSGPANTSLHFKLFGLPSG